MARHFGGGAVQLFDRLHDAARQKVCHAQTRRHRQNPQHDDLRIEAVDLALRAVEAAQNAEGAHLPAGDVGQGSFEAGVLGETVAHQLGRLGGAQIPHHHIGGSRVQGRRHRRSAGLQEQKLAAGGLLELLRHQRVDAIAGDQNVGKALFAGAGIDIHRRYGDVIQFAILQEETLGLLWELGRGSLENVLVPGERRG